MIAVGIKIGGTTCPYQTAKTFISASLHKKHPLSYIATATNGCNSKVTGRRGGRSDMWDVYESADYQVCYSLVRTCKQNMCLRILVWIVFCTRMTLFSILLCIPWKVQHLVRCVFLCSFKPRAISVYT